MLPGRRLAPCSLFALFALLILSFTTPSPARAMNGSIWLRWTATGDDGTIGRATRYDIRYSKFPISGADTVGWWNAATIVNTIGKVPAAPGHRDSILVTSVTYGTRYYAMMRVADEVPNWSRFSNLASFDVVTAVDVEPATPAPPARVQAAPNPFASNTAIRFSIPSDGSTDVSAYDVHGRLVRRLHQGTLTAGTHALPWDGHDDDGRPVRSGIYFIRIQSGDTSLTAKVFRMR